MEKDFKPHSLNDSQFSPCFCIGPQGSDPYCPCKMKSIVMSKKVMMCDPPSGWKYGFPKAIPSELGEDESIIPWLLSEGYPQSEIDAWGKNFYCGYWEQDDETA